MSSSDHEDIDDALEESDTEEEDDEFEEELEIFAAKNPSGDDVTTAADEKKHGKMEAKDGAAVIDIEGAADRSGDDEYLSVSDGSGVSDSDTDDSCPDSEEIDYFYESNRIDLARAFLGKKGGYTMRDLKKFFK